MSAPQQRSAPQGQPPVSADVRTGEILDRIKAVFAARGFDGASMQDLARAAGMSAGNFYRYFPSKLAIIAALIERDMSEIDADFQLIMAAPDPRAIFRTAFEWHLTESDPHKAPLWAEIEAASARELELGRIALTMQNGISRVIIALFARIADISEEEARQRFDAHARLLMLLVKGNCSQANCLAIQAQLDGGDTPDNSDLVALSMRVFDQIVAEIAGDMPATKREPQK
ncbi:MAG: TetR/AcrR family transcriptional regulator [Paracoccaceae bacterium]